MITIPSNETYDNGVLTVFPEKGISPRLALALRELYALGLAAPGAAISDSVLLLPGGRLERGASAARVLDASSAQLAGSTGVGPVTFADDPGIPLGFRGRTVADSDHGAVPLEPIEGERVLATGTLGPLWVRRETTRECVDRVAVLPPALENETLRDAFRPGRAVALLPLICLARARMQSRPAPATILIDDPNLHRKAYGYLDLVGLRRVAREVPMHVTIATIPLDAWYANRSAVEAFSGVDAPLSLCVHGNDHVHHELAQALSDRVGLASLAQAIRRIEALERRTGLSVSRVMVAPHSACSRETVRRLVQVGFEGLVLSTVRHWEGGGLDPTEALFEARPAEVVDGLPVLLRRHVTELEQISFDALLGQPVIVYGHHGDWPNGPDDFVQTVAAVSSRAEVRWGSLDLAVRQGTRAIVHGSTLRLRLATRRARVSVPVGVDSLVVDRLSHDGRDRLALDEQQVDAGGCHSVRSGAIVDASLNAVDAADVAAIASQRLVVKAVSRRILTESRDRLSPFVARFASRSRG